MGTMRRIAILVAFAVLAGPVATAQAGGWATVEVQAPPAGLAPGEPWRAELVIKQHGRTPLDGLRPSVRIDDGNGLVRTFDARPAGRPGTYVADVAYPRPGTWRTRIFDGFTDATPHRLRPLTIASAAPASAFPWEQAIAIAVVVLGWAGALVAVERSARQRYAPAA